MTCLTSSPSPSLTNTHLFCLWLPSSAHLSHMWGPLRNTVSPASLLTLYAQGYMCAHQPRSLPPDLSSPHNSWLRDLLDFSLWMSCRHLQLNCIPRFLISMIDAHQPPLTTHLTSHSSQNMVVAINFLPTQNNHLLNSVNFIYEINLCAHSSPFQPTMTITISFRFVSIQRDYWNSFLDNLPILSSSIHSICCYQ